MQGLGAAYVLAPVLRRLHADDRLRKALTDKTEYFNTHPILAAALLGAAVRIEEEAADSPGEETSAEFLQIMMAPCAAIGDALFWGGLRPLAAVVAMFFALQGSLFAPVALLLVYNLPHLGGRSWGLAKGYALGIDIVDLLERCKLPDLAVRCKQATAILLGALCAVLVGLTFSQQQVGWEWGLLVLPALLLIGWPTRKSVSPLLLVLLVAVVIMALQTLSVR